MRAIETGSIMVLNYEGGAATLLSGRRSITCGLAVKGDKHGRPPRLRQIRAEAAACPRCLLLAAARPIWSPLREGRETKALVGRA